MAGDVVAGRRLRLLGGIQMKPSPDRRAPSRSRCRESPTIRVADGAARIGPMAAAKMAGSGFFAPTASLSTITSNRSARPRPPHTPCRLP